MKFLKFFLIIYLAATKSVMTMSMYEIESKQRIITLLCAWNRLKKERNIEVPQRVLFNVLCYMPGEIYNKKLLSLLINEKFVHKVRIERWNNKTQWFELKTIFTKEDFISEKQIETCWFNYTWLDEIKNTCEPKIAKVISNELNRRNLAARNQSIHNFPVPWY